MKSLLSFMLVLALSLAGSAEARKGKQADIDFGGISCDEFLAEIASASDDDIGAILLWLDGYLSGVTGDTVLRWAGLEQFAENLVLRCQRRGNQRLLDAARRVGVQ